MQSIEYLRDRFRDYYRRSGISLPRRFGRREWGFMFFGRNLMIRHMAFARESDLRRFLVDNVPAHVYYSTAYYRNPSAPRMEDKGWMGADLIFDLDSDHLPGADRMSYEEMLNAVKSEMIKLLDEFILGDLAIDPDLVQLVFSGGRGYHLHVYDPKLTSLHSNARREIVDYVTGRGINLTLLIREVPLIERYGRTTIKAWRIPRADDSGWAGRVTRSVISKLDELARLPDEEVLRILKTWDGIGPRRASQILDMLRSENWHESLKAGNCDIFPTGFPLKSFLNRVLSDGVLMSMGQADEPVTTDVKRLIRVPGSLHGRTGLRVVPLAIDEFRDFDPLRDAMVFSSRSVQVCILKPISIRMGDERFSLKEGIEDVPEYLAVFLIARRFAEIAAIQ